MKLEGKHLSWIIEIIFFVTIAFFNYHAYITTDFWFHLKVGEQIFQTGTIQFTDNFSHSVLGKPIIPYEWLYQVFLYILYSNFALVGVQIMALFFLTAYLLLYRQILQEIFRVGVIARITLCAVLILLTYTYWSERPQIIAFTIFMAILYLVLKRVFQQKNYLWITIPLFWIWTNLHASMILGLALFGAFFLYYGYQYFQKRENSDLKALRDFAIFGALGLIATILPPLDIKVYQLLWKFYVYRELIGAFILEWNPLTQNTTALIIYLIAYPLAAVSFLYVVLKKKPHFNNWIMYLPLLPVALFALSGARQGPFSLPVIFLFLTPFLTQIKLKLNPMILTILGLSVSFISGLVLTSYATTVEHGELKETEKYYPSKAISFVKANLKGNMFNDYNYGGYLLYELGPAQKTFIDGRTEMFVPEVFVDAKSLGDHKYEGEESVMNSFNLVVQKYHISWVILPTENFNVWRILFHPLYYSDNWQLVYFDDATVIFARRDDHLNDETITKFGFSAVTPFQKNILKDGTEENALIEYQKMFDRLPSGVTANGAGTLLFKQKKIAEAKPYFQKAVALDPDSVSAKVNLAECLIAEGDLVNAAQLYKQALVLEPNRVSALKRLEELRAKGIQ